MKVYLIKCSRCLKHRYTDSVKSKTRECFYCHKKFNIDTLGYKELYTR